MSIVLFRAIIQEIVNDTLTEDIIFFLIRAAMVIKNGICWKEYAIIRDSADSSDNIMNEKNGKSKGVLKKQSKKE